MDDVLFRIHPICEAFEADLKSDVHRPLEIFLDGFSGEDRRELFRHLLDLEVDYRMRRGETPQPAEYFARFPDFSDVIACALDTNTLSAHRKIGDHVILRELGRGGMGVVHEALHTTLGRRVALKTLGTETIASEQGVQRFLKECRAVARLHHTNIVPVHEIGRDGNTPYLSMQLIDGPGLDHVLTEIRSGATDSRLAHLHATDRRSYLKAVVHIGAAIADGLEHAHERGIIHRDVKPSNILLDERGNPWLVDFGLARTEEMNLTLPGDVLGTLRYLAPERLSGGGAAPGDIYALGATLYEMVALRPAFTDEDRVQLLRRIERAEPPPLHELEPATSRDLAAVIATAMAKDPRARYADAKALRDDLMRVEADVPIQARRISPLRRCWRWARRDPRWAATIALIFLLLVTGFIGALIVANSFAQSSAENQRLAREEHDQRVRADRSLYLAEMANGGLALNSNEGAARVREIAARWRPSSGGATQQLGWEWFFLDSFGNQEDRVIPTHDVVYSVSWMPSGKALAYEVARELRVFDLVSGETQEHHSAVPYAVHYRRRDEYAVLFDRPDTARVTNLITGERTLEFTPPEGHRIVHRSRDGAWVAFLSADRVTIWDPHSGRQAYSATLRGDFAWSNDSRRFVACIAPQKTPKLVIVDTASWKEHEFGNGRIVNSLAWHPDGACVAAAEQGPAGENEVLVYNVNDGRLLHKLSGHTHRIQGLRYAPSGKLLASYGKDATIRLWDGEGRCVRVLSGHERGIEEVAFDDAGERLASAGGDSTIRIWPLDTRPAIKSFDIGLTPAEKGAFRNRRAAPIPAMTFINDGQTVRLGFRTEVAIDLRTGTEPSKAAPRAWADGGVLTTAAGLKMNLPKEGRFSVASVSPRGDRVIVGGGRHPTNPVGLWLCDLSAGIASPLEPPSTGQPFYVWGPEERAFIVGTLNVLRVLDGTSGAKIHEFKASGWGNHGAAFSPDGREVAIASATRGIRLWNLATGEIRTLPGHTTRAWAVAYHPDGTRLASGGRDRLVRVWDLASGREVVALSHDDDVANVGWDPSGRVLISLTASGTVQMFDATNAYEREGIDSVLGHRIAPKARLSR